MLELMVMGTGIAKLIIDTGTLTEKYRQIPPNTHLFLWIGL